MPTYTYKCPKCSLIKEIMSSISQRDMQRCSCGAPTVRQNLTDVGVAAPLDSKAKVVYSEKEIDRVIGASAEARRAENEERRKKRREGMHEIPLSVKPGSKFNPEALLGDTKRKELSETYSKVVQEDRDSKKAMGQNPDAWNKKGFRRIDI